MDVAEFYQWVRATLNRGDTLDDVIPHYIRAAVKEIENKRDFTALEWWGEFSLTPDDDPVIDLPSRLKKIRFIRFNNDKAGRRPDWIYLKQVSPEKTVSRISDQPLQYWMKGREFAVLDAKLNSKDREFEISAYRYSSFPNESGASGVTHWLVDAIPSGLHAKVMANMAGFMREDDPNMIQNWMRIANEAIGDLITDDEFAKEANGPAEMLYWPDHIPYDRAFQDDEG